MNARRLEQRLRANREPAPPPDLAVRLLQGVPGSLPHPERRAGMARATVRYAAVAVAAAAVVWIVTALFTVGPGSAGVAFAEVLAPVADATGRAGAVHVLMRMRIRDNENFTFVNLAGDLQRVEGWIEVSKEPGGKPRARVEKPGWTFTFDGENSLLYRARSNEALRGIRLDETIEMLWPAAWVRKLQGLPPAGVQVLAHEQEHGQGRLLLRAEGRDTRPLGPGAFDDFERETEVVWDLGTGRLTGLRRWVLHEGQRVLFSELETIEYLPSIPEPTLRQKLPADVRWAKSGPLNEAPVPAPEERLGPREVARRVFEAAAVGDRATVEQHSGSPGLTDGLLAGTKRVIAIGEPFRTGSYAGVYVPYEIEWAGAQAGAGVRKGKLALRDDNPQKRWVVDGGI